MAKKRWSKKKTDILYECWKNGHSPQERLDLVKKLLPEESLPSALSVMRKLAKTDPTWVGWTTRKKNEIEREKLEKVKEQERKKKEREQKKQAREARRKQKEQRAQEKNRKDKFKTNLKTKDVLEIQEKIKSEFFFCTDVGQYVNNMSCIFRVFGDVNEYGFAHGGPCEKCKKMNKHIQILEEIIDGRQKKKPRRNKTSKRRKIKTKSK